MKSYVLTNKLSLASTCTKNV